MRVRVLASILCAVLLLFSVAGCGMKLNKNDTSPSSSAAANSQTPDVGSQGQTTLTGLVVSISNGTIKLDLVKPAEAPVSGATAPSPSASASAAASASASAAAVSAAPASNTVTIGTTVYVKTNGSMSVTVPSTASIILGSKGYVAGSLIDIAVGDFLVVTMNGELATSVVDSGPATKGSGGASAAQPSVSPGSSPGTGVQNTDQTASYFVATDGLNVRSGPTTNDKVLGKLDKGTTVTGTVTNGWLKFTYKDQTGYVKADYLSTTPPADAGNTAVGAPDSTQSATYYVTSDSLNIRSSPDTSAASLGKLAKGDKVTGTISGGWLKFTYKDQTAYCNAGYLSTTAPAASPSASASPSPSPSIVPDSAVIASYTVTIEGLNARSSPDSSSTSLGRLAKGQKVSGTVSGGWLKFTFGDKTAYCYGQYLTKD